MNQESLLCNLAFLDLNKKAGKSRKMGKAGWGLEYGQDRDVCKKLETRIQGQQWRLWHRRTRILKYPWEFFLKALAWPGFCLVFLNCAPVELTCSTDLPNCTFVVGCGGQVNKLETDWSSQGGSPGKGVLSYLMDSVTHGLDPETVGVATFMMSFPGCHVACLGSRHCSPVTCAGDPGASWTIGGGILHASLVSRHPTHRFREIQSLMFISSQCLVDFCILPVTSFFFPVTRSWDIRIRRPLTQSLESNSFTSKMVTRMA